MQNVTEPRPAPLDVVSVVLSALGFGGLVYGLSTLGEGGDAALPAWVPLVLGVAALAVFVRRQTRLQRADRALLDLRTFRSRHRAVGAGQADWPLNALRADVALRIRSLLATEALRHDGERLMCVSHQAVVMVFRYVVEELSEQQLLDVDRTEQVAGRFAGNQRDPQRALAEHPLCGNAAGHRGQRNHRGAGRRLAGRAAHRSKGLSACSMKSSMAFTSLLSRACSVSCCLASANGRPATYSVR